MKRLKGRFEVYDLGDEIHPGFHVGDRIKREQGHPTEGWVSNIKTYEGDETRAFVISSRDDPNEMLKNGGDFLCHGDWILVSNIEDVVVVECGHPGPVTDEEV